jgi:hypothetical protein
MNSLYGLMNHRGIQWGLLVFLVLIAVAFTMVRHETKRDESKYDDMTILCDPPAMERINVYKDDRSKLISSLRKEMAAASWRGCRACWHG